MFNKKKKHWFQSKPHYKRENGSQEQGSQQAAPEENIITDENKIKEEAGQKNDDAVIDNPSAEGNTVIETKTNANGEGITVSQATCSICNMPIRNQYTAIHHKKTQELVHFDCALRELSRENYSKLGRFKKIYYIGSGNFAIVKEFYDKRGHLKNYEIVEKINYEIREK